MFHIQQVSNTNPLENHYLVSNDLISCSIYQNLGASIQELTFQGVSIIKGFKKVEDYKNEHTSSILCPFPGRIEHGKYQHLNTNYHLDPNENNRNNAIHGKVAHEFFECLEYRSDIRQAVLLFSYQPEKLDKGYPFFYQIDVEYIICSDSIQFKIRMENKDRNPIPFGLGWHPYFVCSDIQNSVLEFNSNKEILCDTEMIPNGEKEINISDPFKIRDLHFDTCYTLENKNVSLKTDSYAVDMEVLNAENQFIQIFTPHSRDCIALEPMTCAPDAFNNKKGLMFLQPGDSYTYSIRLQLSVPN